MKKKMDAKRALDESLMGTPPAEDIESPAGESAEDNGGSLEQMRDLSIGQLFNIDPATERELQIDEEKFTVKGMKLIHSPKSRKTILSVLSKENPIESVANATVQVITRLDQVSSGKVNDMVKIKSGLDLMLQVIEVGEASGSINPMSEEEKQTAYAVSVEKYLKQEIDAGRIDKDALAANMQKGIDQMPEEQKVGLTKELQTINKTAVGSTMSAVGNAADIPTVESAGEGVLGNGELV